MKTYIQLIVQILCYQMLHELMLHVYKYYDDFILSCYAVYTHPVNIVPFLILS